MDAPKITITEKRRLMKYAEGATPGVDQPFEVIEHKIIHEGQDALNMLKQLGMTGEGVINGTN